MGCGGGSNNASQQNMLEQEQVYQAENLSNANKRINAAFNGFTPSWYQGIAQAYTNNALPQLQQQQRSAQNQLGFNMANQGLLKSSQFQQGNQAIQDASNTAKTQIANQGQGLVQQEQQQIGNQKATLLGEAQNSAMPGQFATQAVQNAQSIQAPSTFAPIGNAFSNILGGFLNQQGQSAGNQLTSLLTNYFNPINNPSGSNAGAIPSNNNN